MKNITSRRNQLNERILVFSTTNKLVSPPQTEKTVHRNEYANPGDCLLPVFYLGGFEPLLFQERHHINTINPPCFRLKYKQTKRNSDLFIGGSLKALGHKDSGKRCSSWPWIQLSNFSKSKRKWLLLGPVKQLQICHLELHFRIKRLLEPSCGEHNITHVRRDTHGSLFNGLQKAKEQLFIKITEVRE